MRSPASFLLLFAVLCPLLAHSQSDHYVDSLLKITARPDVDSNTYNALTNIQRYYFNRGLYDSTIKYGYQHGKVAIALGDGRRLVISHHNMAIGFTNLTMYDSAQARLDKLSKLLPEVNDTAIYVNYYNTYTLLRNYQSDFNGAIEFQVKAAELIEKSSRPSIRNLLPQTYGNLGHNLIAEKQIEKGIGYERKALRISGYPNEQRFRTMIHLDIFDGYLQLKNVKTAKAHLDSAILLNATLDNIIVSSLVANNEGVYYQAINDNASALRSYQTAFRLCESTGNRFLKAEAGGNIAALYVRMGKHALAEQYAMEANAIARSLREYKVVAQTHETLVNVFSRNGDYKSALEQARLFKIYSDSATNKATQATAVAMENKYQNQRKEKEIAALTVANMQHERDREQRDRLLIGGLVVFVAVLLILGLLYRTNRQRRVIAEKEKQLQGEQILFLERQQQVVSLQSMINGQETERSRIARDLHDGLGGLFSTVKMYFSTLQYNNPQLEKDELFQKGYSVIDTASVEVRRIAHNLMPEVLLKLGLVNALKDLCDNISTSKLLNVSLEVHGMNERLGSTTEIMLFRIVQELLNNIIKHAHASEAIIQCVKDQSRLSLIVEDNGQGFNTAEADRGAHSGMINVQNRVDYLRGKITVDSQKNVGTTVMMDFLINENANVV
jgi:signal transduction histidine kinase